MPRAFLVVMDSVGIGGAPDAGDYFNGDVPDTGANTLGHIAAACAAGQAEDGRSGPLHVPHLAQMGLWNALALATGRAPAPGPYGAATELSRGKDTPSGHWELAGVPVPWDWHYFPDAVPAFPDAVVQAVCEAAGVDGVLGNCHASGTAIIAEHGAAHIRNGWP
ncbi:MAG: phosphopentomutase, partial [Pseudomonadota bacterium]